MGSSRHTVLPENNLKDDSTHCIGRLNFGRGPGPQLLLSHEHPLFIISSRETNVSDIPTNNYSTKLEKKAKHSTKISMGLIKKQQSSPTDLLKKGQDFTGGMWSLGAPRGLRDCFVAELLDVTPLSWILVTCKKTTTIMATNPG
jgi:hypothetical protein